MPFSPSAFAYFPRILKQTQTTNHTKTYQFNSSSAIIDLVYFCFLYLFWSFPYRTNVQFWDFALSHVDDVAGPAFPPSNVVSIWLRSSFGSRLSQRFFSWKIDIFKCKFHQDRVYAWKMPRLLWLPLDIVIWLFHIYLKTCWRRGFVHSFPARVRFGTLCPKKSILCFKQCSFFFWNYAKIMLLSENYALGHRNYAT